MKELVIRKAEAGDLKKLLALYTHLHDNPFPQIDAKIDSIWMKIMNDDNHHILLGFIDENLVTSCVIVITENLTRSQRPYALIENVITHPDFRKQGYASAVLAKAKEIAGETNCYKIMLMTGSKEESTHHFYQQAGFNADEKTAYIIRC